MAARFGNVQPGVACLSAEALPLDRAQGRCCVRFRCRYSSLPRVFVRCRVNGYCGSVSARAAVFQRSNATVRAAGPQRGDAVWTCVEAEHPRGTASYRTLDLLNCFSLLGPKRDPSGFLVFIVPTFPGGCEPHTHTYCMWKRLPKGSKTQRLRDSARYAGGSVEDAVTNRAQRPCRSRETCLDGGKHTSRPGRR